MVFLPDRLTNLQKTINLKLWLYKPSHITLNVSGGDCSLIQAKNIGRYLRKLGEEHRAPFFTFADSYLFGATNVLLLSGHEVFARKEAFCNDDKISLLWFLTWGAQASCWV